MIKHQLSINELSHRIHILLVMIELILDNLWRVEPLLLPLEATPYSPV